MSNILTFNGKFASLPQKSFARSVFGSLQVQKLIQWNNIVCLFWYLICVLLGAFYFYVILLCFLERNGKSFYSRQKIYTAGSIDSCHINSGISGGILNQFLIFNPKGHCIDCNRGNNFCLLSMVAIWRDILRFIC